MTIKTRKQLLSMSMVLLLLLTLTAQAQDNVAMPVTIALVAADDVAPLVPAAGTVFSRNETQITAGMAGRLQWLAEPGDVVTAGTPVAQFDCEMLELRRERQLAEADRAEINADSLDRELERMDLLTAANAVSALQYDRTVANRDLAVSDLRIAKITVRETDSELRRCKVRAPFSGVVTQRLRSAGEDVERSTVLAAMTDTQNLEVRALVPIRYLPRMQAGRIAEVRMNELRLEGRIRKVVPAANSQSQTFEVRLDLPGDAPQVVAAGQLVSVSLPLSATAALTVPRDSVVLREDGAYVMRINDELKAEQVSVKVTDAHGDNLAVSGDLASGDQVAVIGAEALEHGELVAVQAGG